MQFEDVDATFKNINVSETLTYGSPQINVADEITQIKARLDSLGFKDATVGVHSAYSSHIKKNEILKCGKYCILSLHLENSSGTNKLLRRDKTDYTSNIHIGQVPEGFRPNSTTNCSARMYVRRGFRGSTSLTTYGVNAQIGNDGNIYITEIPADTLLSSMSMEYYDITSIDILHIGYITP